MRSVIFGLLCATVFLSATALFHGVTIDSYHWVKWGSLICVSSFIGVVIMRMFRLDH